MMKYERELLEMLPILRKHLMGMINPVDAEDILSTATISIIQSKHQPADSISAKKYMAGIVRKTVLMHHRAVRAEAKVLSHVAAVKAAHIEPHGAQWAINAIDAIERWARKDTRRAWRSLKRHAGIVHRAANDLGWGWHRVDGHRARIAAVAAPFLE